MLCSAFFVVALIVFCSSQPVGRGLSVFQIPQIIKAEGYEAERHNVTTEDGYILEMQRIPLGRHQTRESQGNKDRPAVLLMHGLYSISSAYIVLGHEYSVGYNLADAGFDVWMGNARGNQLSRRHVTLDPDDREQKMQFFDFTWEEIGMYDVAAMIDYILEFTGHEKLHYIGHSQGGTVFLVLASMRPEYNEKFASVHLLAGVGYQNYFPNVMLRRLALLSDEIYSAALAIRFVEVSVPTNSLQGNDTSRSDLCTADVDTKYMCDITDVIYSDIFSNTTNMSRHFGGGSIKQIAHYGQNIRDKEFRRYNYGISKNIELYGQSYPPNYNLSLITAKVVMHYTLNDNLLDERDVLAMAADMPNTEVRRVARLSFEHADFAVATDARELVTEYIIKFMTEIENETDTSDPEKDSSTIMVLSLAMKIYIVIYNIYTMT